MNLIHGVSYQEQAECFIRVGIHLCSPPRSVLHSLRRVGIRIQGSELTLYCYRNLLPRKPTSVHDITNPYETTELCETWNT